MISERDDARAKLQTSEAQRQRAEAALTTTTVKLQETEAKQTAAAQPPTVVPPVRSLFTVSNVKSTSAARDVEQCDRIAAYQYDDDRPASVRWVDDLKDADIMPSLGICRAAADSETNAVVKRRMLVHVGRLAVERGRQHFARGEKDEASKSFDDALASWRKAAALGSAQAYNAVASLYAFGLSNEGRVKQPLFMPDERDQIREAFSNFEKSSKLENNFGRAMTAYYVLFPHWLGSVIALNVQYGRDLLAKIPDDRSVPRADYVRAVAFLCGRGYPPDRTKGAEFMVAAAQNRDAFAVGVRSETICR